MKNLLCLLLLTLNTSPLIYGQIKGNGKIKTISRSLELFSEVFININGKVRIHCGSTEPRIDISYDENILKWVRTAVDQNILTLDQEKWVSGTREVEFDIYVSELAVLTNDSWSVVNVYKINQEQLKINSSHSTINLNGKVKELIIHSEDGIINAYDLEADYVEINISEDGEAYVNAMNTLNLNIGQNALVKNAGTAPWPNDFKEQIYRDQKEKFDTRYINVSFKNNSLKKIHAFVKGPKPDGRYFSYGLNFMPLAKKTERWTIGTKVFKIGLFGKRTLLHEVTADNEDEVVILK